MLIGLLALVIGLVVGWYLNRQRYAPETEIVSAQQVQGETQESTTDEAQSEVAGQSTNSDGVNTASPGSEPKTRPLTPERSDGGRVDVCKTAKDELTGSNAQIEAKYQTDSEKAKADFDLAMSPVNVKLAELEVTRNYAVNIYYEAIAAATTKYNNSSKDEAAYLIYQQERTAAQGNYQSSISHIAAKEAQVARDKKTAQDAYDQALSSAQTKRSVDLAAAQAKYKASVQGQSC